MKRFLIFSISLLLVLSLVACQRNETSTNENQTIKSESVSQNLVTENKADGRKPDDNKDGVNNPIQAPSGTAHEEEPAKDVRIRLTFNNREIIVKMNDNSTSRDLVKKLPLKLTFKDHSGTEKISYLPQKLSAEGSPSGYDPSVGELAYYAPWGNICIYYHDFGYSTGLVPLGSIESGMESLTSIDGDFTVTIEKY